MMNSFSKQMIFLRVCRFIWVRPPPFGASFGSCREGAGCFGFLVGNAFSPSVSPTRVRSHAVPHQAACDWVQCINAFFPETSCMDASQFSFFSSLSFFPSFIFPLLLFTSLTRHKFPCANARLFLLFLSSNRPARVLFFSVLKIYLSKTDLKKEKSLFFILIFFTKNRKEIFDIF